MRVDMNNIEQLRNELSEVFTQIKNEEISTPQARELANVAGKMIGTAKAQLEYYSLRKEKPSIKFLDSTE